MTESIATELSPKNKIEVIAPDSGPNVTRLQNLIPELKQYLDIKHTFDIYNPGKPEATIVIPGLGQDDVSRFKQGRLFGEIISQLNDSVVLFNWSQYTHIPEYTAAQLEDVCLSQGIQRAKIIGVSYGGYAALELMSDIKKNNVPVELTGLVTVVSPTSKEDLALLMKLKKLTAPAMQQFNLFRLLLSKGNIREKLAHSRSANVRESAFRDINFTKEDVLSEVPVLAITTIGEPIFDPIIAGGVPTPDVLVNNQQAAKKLQNLFENIEIVQVQGQSFFTYKNGHLVVNPTGAHAIHRSEVEAVQKRIINFLQSVDKQK